MADAKTTTKTAESTGSAKTVAAFEAPKQKVRTADSGEPDIGWTNQAGSRPDELADPNPVTLASSELPDPEAVAEQGIHVDSFMANFTNVE